MQPVIEIQETTCNWSWVICCSGPATAANLAEARRILPSIGIAYTNFEGTISQMPFGRNSGPVVRALAGGWRISGITTYYSGVGFGTISAPCNLPNAGACTADINPNFSGPFRINGDCGSGNVIAPNAASYFDRNAFQNPAAFTYGSTALTLARGLRGPTSFNLNLSLQREFRITEAWRLSLRGDAWQGALPCP